MTPPGRSASLGRWLVEWLKSVTIALVVWLVVWAVQRRGAGETRSARDILNERYASGEIEHDEYEERLSKLR